MYQDVEDDVCAWCGASLPQDIKPADIWPSNGVCDAQCMVYQAFSDRGIAAGMIPPRGMTTEDRDLILRAVGELK